MTGVQTCALPILGFDGLDDERILKILDVDLELTSREQILALEDNLKEVMEEM